MLKWYQNAEVCYMFLANVPPPTEPNENLEEAVRRARWFTRG